MKKLAFVFFLALAALSNANAHSEKISHIKQDDWIVVMARSLDGKHLKVRYKINSFTQKMDIMAGVYYWANERWNMSLGTGSDDYGNYVNHFNTKYYF